MWELFCEVTGLFTTWNRYGRKDRDRYSVYQSTFCVAARMWEIARRQSRPSMPALPSVVPRAEARAGPSGRPRARSGIRVSLFGG